MVDDYQQAMALMEKMKACLPIDAYPGKGFIYTMKQQGININKKKRLKIEDVHLPGP